MVSSSSDSRPVIAELVLWLNHAAVWAIRGKYNFELTMYTTSKNKVKLYEHVCSPSTCLLGLFGAHTRFFFPIQKWKVRFRNKQ